MERVTTEAENNREGNIDCWAKASGKDGRAKRQFFKREREEGNDTKKERAAVIQNIIGFCHAQMSLFGIPQKRPEEYEGRPCQSFRQALKECLKNSDCVRVERRRAKDCINNGRAYGTVPTRCFELAAALRECNHTLDTTLKIITGEIYQEPPQSKKERSQK